MQIILAFPFWLYQKWVFAINFWHGKTIDELRNSKATKISVASDDVVLKNHKGAFPIVFAAKLQNVSVPASGHMFLSHVTALDRLNREGALLPVPKIVDLSDEKSDIKSMGRKEKDELDSVSVCMEDQLRSLGILGSSDDPQSSTLVSKMLKGINLDASTPHKKVKATISSMEPGDAFKLLKGLADVSQSRSYSGKHVLPWICCILVYHNDYVKSQEPKLLDSLYKV
ncbi:hypothetical protein ACS0TY_027815 [Phlomoides rotata]